MNGIELPRYVSSLSECPVGTALHDIYDGQCSELNRLPLNIRPKSAPSAVTVFLPWRKLAVRCVDQDSYFLLKTVRNRNCVTETEQRRLSELTIAVLGLSVGSNIAAALARGGVGQKFVLVDPDYLETSNLNRMTGCIADIGRQKAAVSMQLVFDENPFLTVDARAERANQQFLDSGALDDVDIVFDEVDDLQFKIVLRKWARKQKKPVIMVTDNGDGVVVHVDRYDRGCSKLLGHTDERWEQLLDAAKGVEDIARLIIDNIVGGDGLVDARMLSSVREVIRGELSSWTQLGTAAQLAGVVSVLVAKEMMRDPRVDIPPVFHLHPGSLISGVTRDS